MTTPEDNNAGAAEAAAERVFQIQKLYVKDISFESPNSPEAFRWTWQPEIDVQMDNSASKQEERFYETLISVTVNVKVEGRSAFLIEVVQGGMFLIDGFNDDELDHLLGSACPNILFPYVRETISDICVRGGFPQMLLAPVNFEALYQRQQQLSETDAG
ncbi:MAG: protein-export chaperone SecB [Thiotrichales bacterium]|nr:protein-export chaperone SecB [Thiotrichales bacterium]|tara:strand:+ start:961 stop:1437 length:477 start_codon:yes stop_codon:yes gene_type:complete